MFVWTGHHYQKCEFHQQQEVLVTFFDFTSFSTWLIFSFYTQGVFGWDFLLFKFIKWVAIWCIILSIYFCKTYHTYHSIILIMSCFITYNVYLATLYYNVTYNAIVQLIYISPKKFGPCTKIYFGSGSSENFGPSCYLAIIANYSYINFSWL